MWTTRILKKKKKKKDHDMDFLDANLAVWAVVYMV